MFITLVADIVVIGKLMKSNKPEVRTDLSYTDIEMC